MKSSVSPVEQLPSLESSLIDEQTRQVIDKVSADSIIYRLKKLAMIGGSPYVNDDEPNKVYLATNREALSDNDKRGREQVAHWMQGAGMEVDDHHPTVLIGRYHGTNPDLLPVAVGSHIDTVPQGDIYDGTVGVLTPTMIVKAMHELGIRPSRSIDIYAFTGEESSGFDFALFGSQAALRGFGDKELAAHRNNGPTIALALGEAGVAMVRQPYIANNDTAALPLPYAWVELHVEQHTSLENEGKDVGIGEAIAAPERYQVNVGKTPILADTTEYAHEKFLRLSVAGQTNHSGATPMGEQDRADGLLETVHLLESLLDNPDPGTKLSIGEIEVVEGAMNKVPGLTNTTLRITGDSSEAVKQTAAQLRRMINMRNAYHAQNQSLFGDKPVSLKTIFKLSAGDFFDPEAMLPRQKTAFGLIKAVNEAAISHAENGVVGTVGKYKQADDGTINLALDMRGIELASRHQAIERVKRLTRYRALSSVAFGKPLAGSGEPVTLDTRLVRQAGEAIEKFEVGSYKTMIIPAGHDTQNLVRAGVPSVMLMIQSNNGGLAHRPEAYTLPKNIQRGARALTALMLELANEV